MGFITVVVLAVPLHTPAPFVFVAEHFIIVAMRATFPSYGLNVNLHDCIAWGTIFTKDTVAFVWQFFLNLVAPKARDGSRAAAPVSSGGEHNLEIFLTLVITRGAPS